MRKLSTQIQTTPLEGAPTQGAFRQNILGDLGSINAYDEARFLAIAALKDATIRQALQQKKDPILTKANEVAGAVIETVQKDPLANEILPELASYYTRVHDNFKKSLEKATLRWSQADPQEAEDVVRQINTLLKDYPALGILHPAEYPPFPQNQAFAKFYMDTMNLANTMQNQNQLTEDDATELVARVLAAVHGKTVSASGSRRTNPLHKLAPYITTTPTNSYAIPAARVISEAIQKSQEFGLDAVTEAIKRAEQRTNQAIKKWTDAMLATLRRDPNDRNKLNRIANKIEQKLQDIQQQYGIEVPDLQSMDDDKKRSYYLRMLENTVQTLIGQTEANKLFLNPRTREGQEITVTPRETTSPEMFTPAQGVFQHEKSTAAMGGVPTMPSTRAEFLREAQRSTTPEATYKEQMESLMTQHWLIFGLMGGFIARSIATEMLRQELANLEESEEQVENNEIKIGLTRGAGPGQVAVRSVTIETENEEGNTEELRVPTYGPVGLPFGRGEFGLQPTTLAGINTTTVEQNIELAGNVRFANAVVMGGHLIQIGSDENASNANITISGKNPQAVETRSIIPVAFEGQTTLTSYQREIEHSILVPKIKVEKIDDDRYRVQATVGQATAPSITQQEIDSIMVLIKGDPNRRIRSFRERLIQSYTKQKRDGSTTVRIPFSQLPLYETLKAIENSSNPQLHSAQLIVRRENLDPNKDEIERNVSLQLTFYIPENDRRLVAEEQQQGSPPTSIGTVKRGMFGRSKYGEAQFMAQQEQTRRQLQQQEMELEDEGEEPIQEEIRTAQIEPPEEITTPASRMVYVTLEINIKGLMEAINWQELETRENEQANPVNEVRKIIRKLYEQAKTSMNAAQPIDTAEAEQMFEKTDIKKAELNEAVQEATKYVHYQIIRKIRLGLNKHNIPNEFAAQIRTEYAAQLDAARNNPAEFELIAAQSALRPKHFEGITYTARPQVIRKNNGSVELSLNVMGAARSTPIKIEFVGIDPNTELNTIVNVYRGISEQNKTSISDGYSGTIIANYSLNKEEVTSRPRVTQLKASRNANQISFAPDTHLTSGASGLPAGIITTIQPSSQTEAVEETNAAIVATRETTTDTGAGQAQSPAFDPDLAIGLDDFSDITTENETNAGMGETGQNEITRAERPQTPIQQADDTANETNARQTQEAERSDNYKVRIYIFSDGGTTDQTNRSFRPTGVGVSVYYVIEKEDGTKEFKGVYIKHYLGDHPNLTNNIAEVYAATTGLTFARAVIEDAIRKGYINEPSEAQILMISDSQNALKWITGNQEANEGAIPAFVKNAAQLVRFNIGGETKFATIKGVYQREGTNSHMARLIKKSNDGSQAVRENANERTKIEIIDPNQAQQDVQAIQNELAITRKLTYEPNHDHSNFSEVQAFNFTDLSVVPSPAAEGRVPPISPLNLQGVLQQLIGQTTETPVATNEIVTEDEGNLFEDMDETELNEAIKATEGDGTRRPFGSRAREERVQSLRANRNLQDRAADTRQARREENLTSPPTNSENISRQDYRTMKAEILQNPNIKARNIGYLPSTEANAEFNMVVAFQPNEQFTTDPYGRRVRRVEISSRGEDVPTEENISLRARNYSALNLKIAINDTRQIPLEIVYQGSKANRQNRPINLGTTAMTITQAKERSRNLGPIDQFVIKIGNLQEVFSVDEFRDHPDAFYNFLYFVTLHQSQNQNLLQILSEWYNAFKQQDVLIAFTDQFSQHGHATQAKALAILTGLREVTTRQDDPKTAEIIDLVSLIDEHPTLKSMLTPTESGETVLRKAFRKYMQIVYGVNQASIPAPTENRNQPQRPPQDEASPEPTPEPAPAQTPAPTPAPAPQGSLLEIAVGKTTTNLDTTNNWVNINNTLIQPPAQRQPNQEPIKQIGKITKTPKTLGGALRAEHRTSPNISQTASNFIQNVMGTNTIKNVNEVTQVTLPIDLIAGDASQGKHTYKPPQVGQQRTQQQNANRRTIDPNLPFVSFHGRRDASLEEMQQCFELGKKIAKSGAVLVVGGAIGADYAAMLGALSEGGKVIVVHHRDFAFDQNGYSNYTTKSLLELFNEAGRLYQRNNFVKQIADQIIRRTNRPVGQTAAEVANKIAAIMTLVTISPHHPTLKAMGIDFPPTAEVLPTTMRIVTKENNQWTAKQAPFLRDKFMVLLTELTIGGPTRNNNSGTAKAVEFANQIAREMPEDMRDKAVMSMEAVLEMDDGDFRGLLEELNNKRQQNLQQYKQQQRQR